MPLSCSITIARMLTIFFFASYTPNVSAQQYSPPAGQPYTLETNLQALIHDVSGSTEKELVDTLQWFSKLPSETSCVQLAAMELMTDCKLLDNPTEFAKEHPQLSFDDINNEYSAKLALCEIIAGKPDHSSAPAHCDAFVPSAEACLKRSWVPWGRSNPGAPNQVLCYPEAGKTKLHQCLKTLHSKPQYWTSYSNANLRATNICHLSRHAIEREQTLQHYKNMTQVVFSLRSVADAARSDAQILRNEIEKSRHDIQQSNAQIKESTSWFVRFTEEARSKAQEDRERIKQDILSVQIDVKSVRDTVISDITAQNNEWNAMMNTSIAAARTAVEKGQADIIEQIASGLKGFFEDQENERSRLLEAMNTDLQQYNEKVLLAFQIHHGAIVKSLDIVQSELDTVKYKTGHLNGDMDALENKIDKSLAKIDILDHRLEDIDSKVMMVMRVFAALQTLFSLPIICLSIISIIGGIIVICSSAGIVRKFRWLLLGSLALTVVFYLRNVTSSSKGFHSNPEYQVTESLYFPLNSIWNFRMNPFTIFAIICFLLAYFLSTINSIFSSLFDHIASFPNSVLLRLGFWHQEDDRGELAVIPSIEIPQYPTRARQLSLVAPPQVRIGALLGSRRSFVRASTVA